MASRDELVAEYGEVLNTQQLQEKYEVHSFLAPFVFVTRRADSVKGTMIFQHDPRFYYRFREDK